MFSVARTRARSKQAPRPTPSARRVTTLTQITPNAIYAACVGKTSGGPISDPSPRRHAHPAPGTPQSIPCPLRDAACLKRRRPQAAHVPWPETRRCRQTSRQLILPLPDRGRQFSATLAAASPFAPCSPPLADRKAPLARGQGGARFQCLQVRFGDLRPLKRRNCLCESLRREQPDILQHGS
jgi:hypothetical protein